MKAKLTLSVIAASLLASCASTPPVNFEGESFASSQLKNDVTKMILMTASAKGCSKIEKIETSVTKEPVGEPAYKESTELWRAYGCNKQFDFSVAFKGDGMGGAYFGIGVAK